MKPLSWTLPQARSAPPRPQLPLHEPLWLEWLALAGLLGFAAWLLGLRGIWALLLRSDPTGITLLILLVFAAASLWCGARSRLLQAQREALGRPQDGQSWAAEFLRTANSPEAEQNTALDLLLERSHGPHGAAWWVNSLQLKLGLLGKVVGFSILAINISSMQSFDPTQTQDLLRSLTSGLGVALLSTMVGLVGNILLGLQLTRLDRYADALVSDIQRAGLALAHSQAAGAPA
ncbi:hypothetical protein DBR47_02865 [Paucibacter sp. KBW04]|uniref:MotA/TolQ/ExbB proton channel family protein n=1 Tax=Paucibacter sp. KBW04 TaxID=2153361 RepID=UPI000F57CA31|nr:MotA/TolQ/ExbB proton channel family protein [Paucibacter sp. KBW04]RQO63488.1 hypothetical protein DBR47_02865 [Paucibacter sp. KBW04]